MRDLLWYDPDADVTPIEPDPIRRAQSAMKRDLPKRFWKEVSLGAHEHGHRILLDGRPVKTPSKRELTLPRPALAEAVAQEWRAQERHLDPATMPVTRIANSIIDFVADRAAEVAADAVKYAGSDLLCYRATGPDRLVERQAAAWDPLLDWADETHGAKLLVAEGVMHIPQDGDALRALARVVDGLDPWTLGGLHVLTTLTGSLVVALAFVEGRLDRNDAWNIAHLDEHWSLELWGGDDEAEARLARRRIEFDAAAVVVGR
jgi:chaperone required for assembly of F1-ATPase